MLDTLLSVFARCPGILALVLSGVSALVAVSPALADIRVEAYAGKPLGIARVVVDLPSAETEAAIGDDRFMVDNQAGRVLYPVAERKRVRKILQSVLGIRVPRSLTFYFWFTGDEPIALDVYAPERVQLTVTPRQDQREYEKLTEDWWKQYVNYYQQVHGNAEFPVGVQTYLTAMWAGRLGQQMPQLEGFLIREREQGGTVTGKLMADEAYRASVLRDLMLGEMDDANAAQALPPAPELVAESAPPTLGGEIAIEPIATHVPEECFYVRFGTFNNYLWFREFVGRWKGDLGNMLVLRSVHRDTSDLISSMLGLKQSKMSSILGPQVIEDVALIGMDPYLGHGAAIGVLFHAKNSFLLSTSLTQQRSAAAGDVEGAKVENLEIAGKKVAYLSSPDGALRSYYASDGQFHLVTSSRAMVERFFQASAGDRPLSAANDFLTTRTNFPIARDDRAFVHLSHAFLSNLTSPAYRIELDRRLRSIETLRALELARLAAAQESLPGESEADLVSGSFLPQGFTQRSDGAEWRLDDSGAQVESLRGYVGRFVPIVDNLPESASTAELRRYANFAASLRSEVGQLAPLTVCIHSEELAPGLDRIAVDLCLHRYSATNLASWAKKLGPPSDIRVAPIAGDVASLNIVLDGLLGSGEPFHLFGGIRDGHVPLVVRGGSLATVTAVTDAVQAYVGAWPRPDFLERFLGRPRGPYDANGFARTSGLFDLWIRRADDFMLFSFKQQVLYEVGSQLAMVKAGRPAQAWLTLNDLVGTQYEQVATSYAYARTRDTSATGSRFMNSLVEQLHVPKPEAYDLANKLVAGEFVCPLGGEYVLMEAQSGAELWASTAAAPNNQFLLTEIPPDYQFPLLEWFRGMHAEVLRGEDSLNLFAEVLISNDKYDGQYEPPQESPVVGEEIPPPPPSEPQPSD